MLHRRSEKVIENPARRYAAPAEIPRVGSWTGAGAARSRAHRRCRPPSSGPDPRAAWSSREPQEDTVGQPQVVEVDAAGLVWVKSSASTTTNQSCVETARDAESVLVRDSNDRTGPRLSYPIASWKLLISIL
ncbi:DUF397 domain-containing protein [Kibdelosporangium lantanae]|uniref:DUF397 domain-containing protein n=1 Tax=Kibdelosporangium lantanae TaxID=1497396 RepID=A0ABW3M4X4_9PSEU